MVHFQGKQVVIFTVASHIKLGSSHEGKNWVCLPNKRTGSHQNRLPLKTLWTSYFKYVVSNFLLYLRNRIYEFLQYLSFNVLCFPMLGIHDAKQDKLAKK